MKKLIIFLLPLAFVLSACNSESGNENKNNNTDTTKTTTDTVASQPDPNEGNTGLTDEEWAEATDKVGDMATWEGIDSYVKAVDDNMGGLKLIEKAYTGGEVDYMFSGSEQGGQVLFAASDYELEPSSKHRKVYFKDGEAVFIEQMSHSMTGEGAEQFTFTRFRVWLSGGEVVKATVQENKGEYVDPKHWDFEGAEANDYKPDEAMLNTQDVLEGLRGEGEWADWGRE